MHFFDVIVTSQVGVARFSIGINCILSIAIGIEIVILNPSVNLTIFLGKLGADIIIYAQTQSNNDNSSQKNE